MPWINCTKREQIKLDNRFYKKWRRQKREFEWNNKRKIVSAFIFVQLTQKLWRNKKEKKNSGEKLFQCVSGGWVSEREKKTLKFSCIFVFSSALEQKKIFFFRGENSSSFFPPRAAELFFTIFVEGRSKVTYTHTP